MTASLLAGMRLPLTECGLPRYRGCAGEDVRHGACFSTLPRYRGCSVELIPASVGMCQTNSRSWLFAPSSGMCLESPHLTKSPRKCGDVPRTMERWASQPVFTPRMAGMHQNTDTALLHDHPAQAGIDARQGKEDRGWHT